MNLRQLKNGFNQIFWGAVTHSPLYKTLGLWYGGLGSILTLHRTVPISGRSQLPQNQHLEVSSRYLERLIEFFQAKKYTFLSLDAVCDKLEEGTGGKKFISLTFDDGYEDNASIALPLLKKYQIPFTIYLTTGFLDRTGHVWWYALEAILMKTTNVSFHFGKNFFSFNCHSLAEKALAFDQIKTQLLRMNIEEIEAFFKTVGEPLGVQLGEFCNNLMLSWDQVRELSQEPLVTLGAHSLTHPGLKGLDEAEVRKEILGSKKQIENLIQKEVKHFAYPFGTPNEVSGREFSLVKEFGFRSAVTTSFGNIFSKHAGYTERLPRLDLHEKEGSLKAVDLLLNGYPLARARRLKRVVI